MDHPNAHLPDCDCKRPRFIAHNGANECVPYCTNCGGNRPVVVTTQAKLTHDPVAVCMMLMFNGQHVLAADTARRFLREAGVNVQTPEQASRFRSQKYAVLGGKS